MSTAIDLSVPPFTAEQTAEYIERFDRDGFVVIPNALQAGEVEALKKACDTVFEDPKWTENGNVYGKFVAARLFETNPVFIDLMVREPIISLVEAILGDDCHLIAENIVRNAPGQSISKFHTDDPPFFPLPEGKRHDPSVKMPVFVFIVQILLTDVESMEYGPSQFVPGSHYAGRGPDNTEWPIFEGREPVPIFGKAGDLYLHNGQCWHRGAPNTSDRMRYLLQPTYARRFIAQRFYPFMNYQLPDYVLEGANERLKRLFGFHPKGSYG